MNDTQLIEFLGEFVVPRRLELFKQVVSLRTRYITVVLEDIFQAQNASAVLRTCDCFGVQDVHIIENSNIYDVNPDVALGSDKWLTMKKYNEHEQNTLPAFEALKRDGYRIVATTPHTDDVVLEDFDLEKGKCAFVFGTELKGLSQAAIDHADEYLRIPMVGFTESFNISVSAAIILHNLTSRLRNSGIEWELPGSERDQLLLEWLRRSVKSSRQLEEEFISRISSSGK